MRFVTNLFTGLLLTGVLALAPSNSFARGGGGGGHFGGGGGGHFQGGGHLGGFRNGLGMRGIGAVGHRFHGAIAQGIRGEGSRHHSYPGYSGYFGPFDYGLDDYTGPYDDDSDSYAVQPAPNDLTPDDSTLLIMSVQNELARLGYYHGPIDGVVGSETERAVRWFQSIDHLPVTGQIDNATRLALRIA